MSTEEKTGRWLRRLSHAITGEARDVTELQAQLREAKERGVVDAETLEMLEGVLNVTEIQVRDIMVPRAQMVFVRRDDTAAKIAPVIIESGHSRYPVMDGDRDDVVGILLAKDVLTVFAQGSEDRFDIRECMRPAVFVPESKRVNVLLRDFRRNRNHMAVVIDEYGGVSGLVTIEDALEQIVGDIDDEFDVEEDQNIRKEGERQFAVRGATPIAEFNEYFGTRFSDEEFDTVAGLVMNQLGRVARRGDAIVIDDHELRVTRADRRRVDLLKVVPPRDVVPLEEREPASD